MSSYVKDYRLRVAHRGATEVDDAVDFVLQSEIADAPTITGGATDLVRCTVRSRPWSVSVIDADAAITREGRLREEGRSIILGRLVDLQLRVNAGAWETIATGRLGGIEEMSGPGLFTLRIEDESYHARSVTAFNQSDTTSVDPVGLRWPWRRHQPPLIVGRTFRVIAHMGDGVVWLGRNPQLGFATAPKGIDAIIEDARDGVRPGESGFKHLRAVVFTVAGPSSPMEVVSLNQSLAHQDPVGSVRDTRRLNTAFVKWEGTLPEIGTEQRVNFHMEGKPPTPDVPLHIGVRHSATMPHAYGTESVGIDPFDLVERLYDEHDVRFDREAVQALQGRYERASWRITEPTNLSEWLSSHIYAPLRVLPWIDPKGRISPLSSSLPAEIDPDLLPVLTPQNVGPSHPTWEHRRSGLITAVAASYTAYRQAEIKTERGDGGWQETVTPEEAAVDLISATDEALDTIFHDRHEELRGETLEVDVTGWEGVAP